MTCKCKVCLYSRKVGALVDRTTNARDRALIDDLYNRLMHAEDDRDFHSVKNEACGLKHGGISFPDACTTIDAAREAAVPLATTGRPPKKKRSYSVDMKVCDDLEVIAWSMGRSSSSIVEHLMRGYISGRRDELELARRAKKDLGG